ncbi:hypothetical protein BJ170DRAFT_636167 [Xylariales sp. AK1849]|nr:hypothetical protein BJ170DRAFT_636167 [Xylariales sp. AK1849]
MSNTYMPALFDQTILIPDFAVECLDSQPMEGIVSFPLVGVPSLHWIRGCHRDWRCSLGDFKLASQRKHFCKEFNREVVRAYELVNDHRSNGRVSDLRNPLYHLLKALEILRKAKNYDDVHPFQRSELPEKLPEQDNMDPEGIWLNFKLAFTKTCLLLLIRILWHVMPDRADTWSDWEGALKMPEWHIQFVLDSYESQKRSAPKTRRRDVLGAGSQNGQH